MAYFNKDFIEFFKELAGNNNKDWFDANRIRYKKEVKDPFQRFVGDLIAEVHKDDPGVNIEPKDAIFRINRDIRFSQDKTPYKLQVSAIISSGGRKDMVSPGMYIEFTPEHVRVYGGVYMPDKEVLYAIRQYISDHSDEFSKLLGDKDFKSKYGELRGEKNKVIPSEFKEAGEDQPLIYNKQFYYFGQMNSEVVLADDLLQKVMAYYKAGNGMKKFLEKALKS